MLAEDGLHKEPAFRIMGLCHYWRADMLLEVCPKSHTSADSRYHGSSSRSPILEMRLLLMMI